MPPIPLELDVVRPDVAAAIDVDVDDPVARCGFQTGISLPDLFGKVRFRIAALGADGLGLIGDGDCVVHIGLPPLPDAPDNHAQPLHVAASLLLRDTLGSLWTFDRGPHSVRAAGSMIVRGDVAAPQPTFLRVTGAGVQLWYALPRIDDRHFHVSLSIDDLPIGGYAAALFAGSPARPVVDAFFEIAGDHLFLPQGLARFVQLPEGGLSELLLAGVQPAGSSRSLSDGRVHRGVPLWISGVGRDPAGASPFIAVYAQVDDRRPIPIPRWDGPDGSTTFGGIVDTARLERGSHRLEVLGVAALGNGVYQLGERLFTVIDTARYAAIEAIPELTSAR